MLAKLLKTKSASSHLLKIFEFLKSQIAILKKLGSNFISGIEGRALKKMLREKIRKLVNHDLAVKCQTHTLYISIFIITDSREENGGAASGPQSKGMPPPFPYI